VFLSKALFPIEIVESGITMFPATLSLNANE
jgi:hypothetical protein